MGRRLLTEWFSIKVLQLLVSMMSMLPDKYLAHTCEKQVAITAGATAVPTVIVLKTMAARKQAFEVIEATN